MTNDMPEMPQSRWSLVGHVIGYAVVAATLGFAGIYGIAGYQRNVHAAAPCAPALEISRKIAPLATGEVAALTVASKPRQVPDLAFMDSEGQPRKLSDWKGKTVLLNLWATWCVPCRKEMPALDSLQGKLGGDKFAVVAINIDTRDAEKPKAFLKEGNMTRLGYFSDSKANVFKDLKSIGLALGMPTSVLVDGDGCEIANIAGPAEWASDDAIRLITAATQP
jgi:thiol-disulfide isomerase/thioredoxin